MQRILTVLLALLTFSVSAEQASGNADAWLERMSQALNEKQFKASMVHLQTNQVRPLIYLHGHQDGEHLAFMDHLNGPFKSAVRIDNVVTYLEQDQPPYSVKSSRIPGLFPPIFAGDIHRLDDGYQFVLGGRSRIAARMAQLVRIVARDENRFSYMVWLDTETALPLRIDMLAGEQLLDRLMVIELTLTDEPPVLLLEAARREWPATIETPSVATEANWHFGWLPDGFKETVRDQHRLFGANEAVEYVSVSDGMVQISVYLAVAGQVELPEHITHNNGTAIATARHGELEVVAIGKVPADTLHQIALNIRPGDKTEAQSQP
ncbi:MucB/RseB C-terminal domain-containing protein [Paraferrimonas haliotis]|uniref:Sigma-E factor regulatory protein RseB n=1 Tax=Paraferrimonas haliotis TaxID=2013866 RepID=A0AA37TTC4_9GAMM|nr:MucB/RseB C-terminal domain-containing protein [Paraferrimonas haliotis]GLS82510.1 sigma-E factor regulatory protein RseB [Paraferrimonas haliotis]